jgi:hypothetical protein
VVKINDDGTMVSAFMLAPHGAGATHVDVVFTPVGSATAKTDDDDTPATAKIDFEIPKGETTPKVTVTMPETKDAKKPDADAKPTTPAPASIGLDWITDEPYSGALRLGVGFSPFNHTAHYSSFTPSGTAQAEIVESDVTNADVVVGYSVYCETFGRGGRTYHIGRVYDIICKHLGVYGGVGVLGYDGTKLDYLKSLYIGPEIQINRNVALAFTLNIRRGEHLESGRVGGMVATSGLDVGSRVSPAFGIVFNVTTEFLEFAQDTVAK